MDRSPAPRARSAGSPLGWLIATGLAVSAAACGRFGYEFLELGGPTALAGSGGAAGAFGLDSLGGAGDGGPPLGTAGGAGLGGAAGSSSSPLEPCAVLGDFDEPELVQGLGAGPFFSPALFDGELALAFASPPPADLFSARRASRDSTTFGAVSALSVNTGAAEVTPWVSPDGLTLLFASDRSGALSTRDLLQATRPSSSAAFGTPTFLTDVNSFWSENLPSLHDGGRLLLFSSDRPGGAGIADLWQATRATSSGPFTSFAPISELNSIADDTGAALPADELRVYFTSERSGGVGGRDLWFAERASSGEPFATPQNLQPLNSASDDADAAVSRDGRELFFVSDRSGSSQIWRALRACLTPGP